MTALSLTLRHLAFSGPNRETEEIEFGAGLNVIYGASETGKSFILESLDFMLGGSEDLRDIPERVGYDRVWLGIEAPDGKPFTLERAAVGGKFSLYEGLHKGVPSGSKPTILSQKHNPQKENNVSMFLLGLLGLAGKRIRKNVKGETNSLSFRNLVHLCLIPEGDIQKRSSPIETSNVITHTLEMSTFRLLVTGVDDSAIQATDDDRSRTYSKSAKLEVLDEVIGSYKDKLTSLVGEEDNVAEIEDQLNRLDDTLQLERTDLQQLELQFRDISKRRFSVFTSIENAETRRGEIEELLARFGLLSQHYQSDIRRLAGLREAGSLLGALSPGRCPLCGAASEHQKPGDSCDGNVEVVVAAADAETAKVQVLMKELAETIAKLRSELVSLDQAKPALREQLVETDIELTRIAPSLAGQRASFSEISEKRASVNTALSLFEAIADLEQKKIELVLSSLELSGEAQSPSLGLSTFVMDEFSEHMRLLLKSWNFPETERVHFDSKMKDFVISGKPRSSRGKGMRAITHSAFSIALLEFTRERELSHPGFVVLDTPLLAYREPEHDDSDDLSETDIKDHFYDYLSKHDERQVIVLENATPSQSVIDRSQTFFFTKNEHKGRYGLFARPTKRD